MTPGQKKATLHELQHHRTGGRHKFSPVSKIDSYQGKARNPPMCIKHDQIKERFQECKIPLYGCYTEIDALSQIVGLMSPPTKFKPRVRKHYANINMHPYKLAQITDQSKENIKETFSPADKLGKFDINKDSVDKWTSLVLKYFHLNGFKDIQSPTFTKC